MKIETEQALRVKSIALDIIEETLKNEVAYEVENLKQSTELLARCVCDLVNIYTDISEDHETLLKGTIVKAKVGYNLVTKANLSRLELERDSL